MQDIYIFPSCSARLLNSKDSMIERIISLLTKLNFNVKILQKNNFCCGLMYTNMGYPDIGNSKFNQLIENFAGKFILIENMSCFNEIKKLNNNRLNITNPIDLIYAHLNKLNIRQQQESAVLHINCSVTLQQMQHKVIEIAQMCLNNVIIPYQLLCCGFAGSKGFTNADLNKNAVKNLNEQIPSDCKKGYTCLETCALGFNQHTKIHFTSLFHLLDTCAEKNCSLTLKSIYGKSQNK